MVEHPGQGDEVKLSKEAVEAGYAVYAAWEITNDFGDGSFYAASEGSAKKMLTAAFAAILQAQVLQSGSKGPSPPRE